MAEVAHLCLLTAQPLVKTRLVMTTQMRNLLLRTWGLPAPCETESTGSLAACDWRKDSELVFVG
jgi:hypothetical protein